jgi:hypothetical protein
MNRREMLFSTLAMPTIPSVGLAASSPEPIDQPFLADIQNRPGDVGLVYPMDRITHAFSYFTVEGRMIYAEGQRCREDIFGDGRGWRTFAHGEWDGRIVGRIVSIHSTDSRGRWFQYGSGELAG